MLTCWWPSLFKTYWNLKRKTKSPQWSLIKAPSCCGDASLLQALEGLWGWVNECSKILTKNLEENLLQSDRDLPLGRRFIFIARQQAQKESHTEMVPTQPCQCLEEAKSKPRPQLNSVPRHKLFNHSPHYTWLKEEGGKNASFIFLCCIYVYLIQMNLKTCSFSVEKCQRIITISYILCIIKILTHT